MPSNFRRGVLRIATVTVLPWAAYWGWSLSTASMRLHTVESLADGDDRLLADMRRMDSQGIRLGGSGSGHGVLGMDASTNQQVLDSQTVEVARLRSEAYEARQWRNRAAQFLILGPLALAVFFLLG